MRTRKDRILSIGTEVECHVVRDNIVHGTFHHDGSVDVLGRNRGVCDGSCRDDCCCYDDCECTGCILCTQCGDTTSDCYCFDCMICNDCSERVNACGCDWKRQNCPFFEVEAGIVEGLDVLHHSCEHCKDIWITNRCETNCHEVENVEWNCERDCDCDCECDCDCFDGDEVAGQDGEIVSTVLNENTIEGWLDENENAIKQTNKTCGMHVHVGGLNRLEYGILMTPEFTEYVQDELTQWGKQVGLKDGTEFFKRLKGLNTYCRDSYQAEAQKMDMDKNSSRYCIVNYCWGLHQTVEIRVLPSFQMHKFRYKAIAKVIDIVHTFIDNNNKPKIHSLEIKEVI